MALRGFEHVSVQSLEQAAAAIAGRGEKAVVVAGGTDLLGILKDNVHPSYPERLVDIKPIAGLRRIRAGNHSLRIGALTTLAEVEKHELVRGRVPMLAEAARAVASPQIRNMGTVGGNLCQEPRCWYYRAPDNTFHCLRKGGDKCGAAFGDNRFHSLFGAARVGLPPCAGHCPAHVPIPDYLERVRQGDLSQAARALLARNPMPAVTGRVCPHFCEQSCNRCDVDQAVSIRAIERHLGDYILDHAEEFYAPPRRRGGKRVAVIGAGPGGLSAAWTLRQAGHAVTVFDSRPEAGGMLTYGIPSYRLPKEVVQRLVAAYRRCGVEFELGVNIDAAALKKLRKSYHALFLATGAWKQKGLRIDHAEKLEQGIDFLAGVLGGAPDGATCRGQRILVIGGGNVAVDVAITAKRLGAARVTMACLESRQAMPAFPEEIAGALQEGIELLPAWGPREIEIAGDAVAGMVLKRCTSVFDAKGQFHPTFDEAEKTRVAADRILLAIGQGPDLGYLGAPFTIQRGWLVAHGETQATSVAGVYAGGDMVTGPTSVVEALAAGRRAAEAIDRELTGRGRTRSGEHHPPPEPMHPVRTAALSPSRRVTAPELEPPLRTVQGEDVRTLDGDAVRTEAERCIDCGCIAVSASDLAPALLALGARIRTTRRTLAAEEFFAARLMSTTALEPGELVTEIAVPVPEPGVRQAFHKFRLRNSIDFPIVSVASVLRVEGGVIRQASVVLGAVAPVPLRARQVEQFLVGRSVDSETAERAGAIASAQMFPLPRNGYKAQIVRALLRRAILGAA
jgi:NADPH-dependent glutamate synthase beta subunit-like oxidoreductase/CO/xanthine dehydrogenase FAD-binding subunit